ncbi:MAG: biopolymer transporter ExbD, partial [Acinetobacter sp.]
QANNNPIQSEDRPAIVSLEADGTIKLEDKVHNNDVMTLDELKAVLVENQKQAVTDKKQLTVLINGSESRPYGEVIKLMAALQDAGLSQVGLLTEPVK